jgi:hypothetical protein
MHKNKLLFYIQKNIIIVSKYQLLLYIIISQNPSFPKCPLVSCLPQADSLKSALLIAGFGVELNPDVKILITKRIVPF